MNSTVVKTTHRNILGTMPPLPILTDRLLIRQLLIPGSSDVHKFHDYFARHQKLDDTARALAYLTDTKNGSLCLGIFLQQSDQSEGDLIGLGGVREAFSQGTWPIFSCHFYHPEYLRDVSLGMEFTRAFMEFWWSIPEETAKFPLQVPASSVGYPQREETDVAPRVVASALLEDTTMQHILAEAGFKKYLVTRAEDGQMTTYWRHLDTATSRLESEVASSSSCAQLQQELDLATSSSTEDTSFNAKDADGARNVKLTNTGGKLVQKSPEPKPTDTEITMALWHMLAEDIESKNLDVFQLPVSYVEGYVPLLSRRFGTPLENRRGKIWAGFETCLMVQRGNRAHDMVLEKQPVDQNADAVRVEVPAQASVLSGLPALRPALNGASLTRCVCTWVQLDLPREQKD